MSTAARASASRIVAATIHQGSSLADTLPPAVQRAEPGDRALLQQLCYGTLRSYHRLQGILDQLLKKPLKTKDADIQALLLVGLYQVMEMRIPDHASISATVEACRKLKKPWATGLVNGVLRRASREEDTLLSSLKTWQQASHPAWLLQMLKQQWPEQWESVVEANNEQPPMCLRVNLRRSGRQEYLDMLEAAGIEANPCRDADSGIRLSHAVDIGKLPGFGDGLASVQDEAAQLAAYLLAPAAGDRILDACAAPGSKACHLLELEPEIGELVAMDSDPGRLERVQENLTRLGLSAKCVCADASKPPAEIAEHSFNRILLDAPCSGSGVIRRHPDIKLLRRESDLAGFAATQLAILQGLWPLLRPGGTLLYATCSVLAQENQQLLERFLALHSDAREDPLEEMWGQPCTIGRQVLPTPGGADGLYYARLVKPC